MPQTSPATFKVDPRTRISNATDLRYRLGGYAFGGVGEISSCGQPTARKSTEAADSYLKLLTVVTEPSSHTCLLNMTM